MPTRRRVRYQGSVQGVGFRYTTTRVAKGYNVVGYVKNMPDGTVELVAEGEKGEVEDFLDDVKSAMQGHIRHADVSEGEATGQFQEFEVRH